MFQISKTRGQRENHRKSAHAALDKTTNPGGQRQSPWKTTNNEDSDLKMTILGPFKRRPKIRKIMGCGRKGLKKTQSTSRMFQKSESSYPLEKDL